MRRRRHICVVLLLLAPLPALAQFRGGWRGRPAPLTGDQLARVKQVLQAARQDAEAAPAWAAPQLLIAVARAELPQFRSQALADDTAAFQLALALPAPAAPATAAGQAREQIKRNAELEAVSELARNAGVADALALVRVADIPKAPLYDQLLLSARATPAAAMNLVEECELDGAFPYRGAAVLLERRRLKGFDLTALVTDGILHAGDETDPAQLGAAVFFLQAGRRAAPALDAPLETAALALLRRIDDGSLQAALGSASPFDRSAGVRLLALLRQLDPPRAAQWVADHPGAGLAAVSATPAGLEFAAARAGFGPALMLRSTFGPVPLGPLAAGPGPDPAPFLARLNQAAREQRSDPDAALAAADQAADLLDADLLAAQAPAAARLALIFARLGDSADAGTLMAQCLDTAGRLARQADDAFTNADAAAQAQQALHLQAAAWRVTEIYALAAQFDLPTTIARAESANFTLDKPLVLARLALTAQLDRPRN